MIPSRRLFPGSSSTVVPPQIKLHYGGVVNLQQQKASSTQIPAPRR
jgi:hypothetical protein